MFTTSPLKEKNLKQLLSKTGAGGKPKYSVGSVWDMIMLCLPQFCFARSSWAPIFSLTVISPLMSVPSEFWCWLTLAITAEACNGFYCLPLILLTFCWLILLTALFCMENRWVSIYPHTYHGGWQLFNKKIDCSCLLLFLFYGNHLNSFQSLCIRYVVWHFFEFTLMSGFLEIYSM